MRPTTAAVGMVLIATVSVQAGSAFAKSLFGEVSPVAMVWLRLVAAGLLLLLTRPSFAGLTRRDWGIGLAMGASVVTMNWSIYEAIARIPLGLAVMIEFMGPLGIALLGCRKLRDLIWVMLAAGGVAILGFRPTSLDIVGIGFAVIAALCWAGYIWFGSKLSSAWRGTAALSLACWLGAAALAAPAIASSGTRLLALPILATALAIGLLSSVIPYSLELRAMKTLPPKTFGILMALEPVSAALAGLVVLGEVIGFFDWVAISCIVIAAVGVVRSSALSR